MPKDEPANIYALYTSSNLATTTQRRGAPKRTYVDQISEYISLDRKIKFNADEIVRYATNKSDWVKIVAAPNQLDR